MTHAAEFATQKKTTRCEKFLTRREAFISWAKLRAVIETFYPKGQRGRPPIRLEWMLRVYSLLQWYGLDTRSINRRVAGPKPEVLKRSDNLRRLLRVRPGATTLRAQ